MSDVLDHLALIKISVRIINNEKTDTFLTEIFFPNYCTMDLCSWVSECVYDYTDHGGIDETIEIEKLPNGLHHFLIGFDLQSAYNSYDGSYDTYYVATLLKHTRPQCLNDVREFLIRCLFEENYENLSSDEIDRKYEKLSISIARNSTPKSFKLK